MWTSQAHQVALLELWSTGRLRRRKRWAEAWDSLDGLTWVRQAGRQRVLVLTPPGRAEVEALLDRFWPDWRATAQALEAEGLAADEHGFEELARRRWAAGTEDVRLPERVNRRSLASLLAPPSKASPAEIPPGVTVTEDGIVRLRPSPGLRLVRQDREYDALEIAGVLGEVVLSERALLDGTHVGGALPRAVVLVENRGPYIDLQAPAGWLVAHVPGWETSTLALLLADLPGVPLVHFGDLDPKGVQVVRHLRALRPDLLWFVPAFWEEHLSRALRCDWPRRLVGEGDPSLVRKLATRELWLEQELVALDPRFPAALEQALAG